jgi:hypothetical protein
MKEMNIDFHGFLDLLNSNLFYLTRQNYLSGF